MVTVQLPYLHAMAKRGNLTEVMRMLHLHPFLVNAEEENSDWTPLMLAAREGRSAVVLYLLKAEADPNLCDRERWTALHWACACGQLAAATLLLKHGADASLTSSIGQTPLMLAAMNGHAAIVRLLLALNGSLCVNATTRNRETSLWWACYEGHVACARALLLARADPDLRDKRGRSPLDMALAEGHVRCVQLFTEWERSYFLYKVWSIADAQHTVTARGTRGCPLPTIQNRMQNAPSCLRQRLAKGTSLPKVDPPAGGQKKRKVRGEGTEEGLVREVVRTVMCDMKRDLFLELLDVMGRTCG